MELIDFSDNYDNVIIGYAENKTATVIAPTVDTVSYETNYGLDSYGRLEINGKGEFVALKEISFSLSKDISEINKKEEVLAYTVGDSWNYITFPEVFYELVEKKIYDKNSPNDFGLSNVVSAVIQNFVYYVMDKENFEDERETIEKLQKNENGVLKNNIYEIQDEFIVKNLTQFLNNVELKDRIDFMPSFFKENVLNELKAQYSLLNKVEMAFEEKRQKDMDLNIKR